MNNILEEAKKLNCFIKESKEFKEYQTYLYLKNNSHELNVLLEKLEKEKNKVCIKNESQSTSTELYYQIKKEIDNHPIMVNYQNAYEKLNQYLLEITTIINKDL